MLEQVPAPVTKVWAWLNESEPTYLVGGALRDLLGHGVPEDWDLTTRLTPDAVEAIGRQKGYRVIPTGKAFGTVTWLSEGGPIEVTTFRREGRYRDGRRPDHVEFAASIEILTRIIDVFSRAQSPQKFSALIPWGGGNGMRSSLMTEISRIKETSSRITLSRMLWQPYLTLHRLHSETSL